MNDTVTEFVAIEQTTKFFWLKCLSLCPVKPYAAAKGYKWNCGHRLEYKKFE